MTRFIALAAVAWLLAASQVPPAPAHAADPTSWAAPSATPATCAERYPADGPAGVDLLLGCVVSELVRYAGGLGGGLEPDRKPPRLTAYLLPIAMVAVAVMAVLLVVRVARRDAGRRLAPAVPSTWWSCPACRSLNAAGRPACYRCGHVFEAGATELRVDAEPLAPQSFGRRFDLNAVDRPPTPPELPELPESPRPPGTPRLPGER